MARPMRLDRLDAAQADAVRTLAEQARVADGVAPFDEQTVLRLDPASARSAVHILLPDDDGSLLGYAQVADGSAELAVAPPARRHGHGRDLLRAARAVASATQTEHAGSGAETETEHGAETEPAGPDAEPDAEPDVEPAEASLAVWAHGDLPAARALAAAEGLTRSRELLRMATRVAPGPVPAEPAGLRIETFDAGRHAEAWVRVNARAFATHPEQGRLTRTDLDERTTQGWFDPDLLLLAFDEATTGPDAPSEAGTAVDGSTSGPDGPAEARSGVGREAADPVGFIWMKPGEADDEAELYVLGVDPSAQGRGIGRDLTARGLAEVAARGRTLVDLYVEGDNTPALATYDRQGFAVVERHAQYA